MEIRLLTPQESRSFEANGYLVVPGALDQTMLGRVQDAVVAIYERKDEDVPLRAWYVEHGLGQPHTATGAAAPASGAPVGDATGGTMNGDVATNAAPESVRHRQRVAATTGTPMDA